MSNDKKEDDEILDILKELEKFHYQAGPTYQRVCRYKALSKINELEAIYNLVESHCPGLRHKTVLRYEKLLAKGEESSYKRPFLQSIRDDIALKCPTSQIQENVQIMLGQMAEMPKEWTIVQLTPQYNARDNINEDDKKYYTNPIHISVFYCGQRDVEPFLVTTAEPRDPVNGRVLELADEMMSIIKGNKEALTSSNKQKNFRNHREKMTYFNRRQIIEDRLRNLIKDIQNLWLKEWRCLLNGKYVDQSVEERIKTEIGNFLKTCDGERKGCKETEQILRALVKSRLHLKLEEISRAVYYCFPNEEDKKFLNGVVHFIRQLGDKLISDGVNMKKHPVILVPDESLDCFPWEMIDVLEDQPVSRVPSFYFVYLLFKEHEADIEDGHKIVTNFDKGAYIVNPDMDLRNMEIRMMNFFNYWTPEWIGFSGYHPTENEFYELLTSSDIFSYNGHGSGSHLMSMDKIQRTHVKAVVLLFGCGSTKLNRLDPQVEMYGPYHMYLIARCPCVVGMLWEVTDLDTDVLTTEFLSQWIPSTAPTHWKYVDQTKWKKAEEKIKFVRKKSLTEEATNYEPELLRALSKSKEVLFFYGTKSACVARGLPVKVRY